jgi:hypothetical protein
MPLWHCKDSTTRAYDWWFGRERELRAFLKFGLAFGEEGLQRRWDEIEQRPSDGSEETIDAYSIANSMVLGPLSLSGCCWQAASATP